MPTPFQKKLTTIALHQYDKYHLLRENAAPLASQIERYWKAVAQPSPVFKWHGPRCSSPCVRQAGAKPAQFKFAAAHSVYFHAAIANTKKGSGVFLGRDVAVYAPKLGDILQNNRAGNSSTSPSAQRERLGGAEGGKAGGEWVGGEFERGVHRGDRDDVVKTVDRTKAHLIPAGHGA